MYFKYCLPTKNTTLAYLSTKKKKKKLQNRFYYYLVVLDHCSGFFNKNQQINILFSKITFFICKPKCLFYLKMFVCVVIYWTISRLGIACAHPWSQADWKRPDTPYIWLCRSLLGKQQSQHQVIWWLHLYRLLVRKKCTFTEM